MRVVAGEVTWDDVPVLPDEIAQNAAAMSGPQSSRLRSCLTQRQHSVLHEGQAFKKKKKKNTNLATLCTG
jgi:hypothetical protein